MAQRTGLPTILQIAKRMCRLIAIFTPVVKRIYPSATALHAALAAANAACEILSTAIEDTLPDGV